MSCKVDTSVIKVRAIVKYLVVRKEFPPFFWLVISLHVSLLCISAYILSADTFSDNFCWIYSKMTWWERRCLLLLCYPIFGGISEITLGTIYQNRQIRVIKLMPLDFRLRAIVKYLVLRKTYVCMTGYLLTCFRLSLLCISVYVLPANIFLYQFLLNTLKYGFLSTYGCCNHPVQITYLLITYY